MVKIKEYRIPLPITVEQYQIGQLYSVAQASKADTGGGEGVEVLKNEPFENEELGKGQYTHKVYHLASRMPGWAKALAPKSALHLFEEAWNCYPYCRTVLTSPFMGEKLSIKIETWHKPGDCTEENAHELDEKTLKSRATEELDIANDELNSKDEMQNSFEPSKLEPSEKAGKGPLGEEWRQENADKDMMTAYKQVTAHFSVWGFQTKVENYIIGMERDIFLRFHKQLYCWIDEWYDLSMEDIRRIEEETKAELDKMRSGEGDEETPGDEKTPGDDDGKLAADDKKKRSKSKSPRGKK